MTRLIPGKTKVDVELFRGVTLGDLVVAGISAAMIIFVLISTLPYKFAICIGVAMVAGLLLIRIDEQANYVYILHILSHFSYDRRYAKRYSDKVLLDRGSEKSPFKRCFFRRPKKARRGPSAAGGAKRSEPPKRSGRPFAGAKTRC